MSERFARIADEFALVAAGQLTCGMHVHISVSSPDEGIGVLDRIRGWLPVLTALCANSPFWQVVDSGYASYRTIILSQLPPIGPAPIWGSPAAYQRAVAQTIATGGAFDPGMVYFDARLSHRYPTIEIRVTDVCRDMRQAVTIAALCRALVETAAAEWARGIPPDNLATAAIRSASWRAVRHGLAHELYDPALGRLAAAWDVVARLVSHVSEALKANSDSEFVGDGLRRLRERGSNAERQRAARARGLGLGEVLTDSRIDVGRIT